MAASENKVAVTEQALIKRYKENGYLLEDEIIDYCLDYDLDLPEIDIVCDRLLKRNILFREQKENRIEQKDEVYDRSHIDYDSLYIEILDAYPGLKTLIDEIKNILPPQGREWQTLIGEAQNGNDYAVNRMTCMYSRTILKFAYSYAEEYLLDIEDCFQDAAIGLLNAINKYDISSPDSFASYYSLWLVQSIRREAILPGVMRRIPAHLKEQLLQMEKILNEDYQLFEVLGEQEKELIENAIETGHAENMYASINQIVTKGYVADILGALDEKIDYSLLLPDLPYLDVFPTSYCIEDDVENKILKDELKKNMAKLSDREREVINMRYGFADYNPMTLEEVGEVIGVTRERIRQIEKKALKKLRLCRSLKDYFYS